MERALALLNFGKRALYFVYLRERAIDSRVSPREGSSRREFWKGGNSCHISRKRGP